MLVKEKVFLNRTLYQEAERHYSLCKHDGESCMLKELNKVRNQKKSSPNGAADDSIEVSTLLDRLCFVENENKKLKSLVEKLESRLSNLESGDKPTATAKAAVTVKAPVVAPVTAAKKAADDDDIDLFGDIDEESEEQKKVKEERVKAYADKKSKSEYLTDIFWILICLQIATKLIYKSLTS